MHDAGYSVDRHRLVVWLRVVVDDDELALGPVPESLRELRLVLVGAEPVDRRCRLEVKHPRAGTHVLIMAVQVIAQGRGALLKLAGDAFGILGAAHPDRR